MCLLRFVFAGKLPMPSQWRDIMENANIFSCSRRVNALLITLFCLFPLMIFGWPQRLYIVFHWMRMQRPYWFTYQRVYLIMVSIRREWTLLPLGFSAINTMQSSFLGFITNFRKVIKLYASTNRTPIQPVCIVTTQHVWVLDCPTGTRTMHILWKQVLHERLNECHLRNTLSTLNIIINVKCVRNGFEW